MMLVNDDSKVVNKLEASLTDDARVVIYNCHMFIVQATSFTYFCIFLLKLHLHWRKRLQICPRLLRMAVVIFALPTLGDVSSTDITLFA